MDKDFHSLSFLRHFGRSHVTTDRTQGIKTNGILREAVVRYIVIWRTDWIQRRAFPALFSLFVSGHSNPLGLSSLSCRPWLHQQVELKDRTAFLLLYCKVKRPFSQGPVTVTPAETTRSLTYDLKQRSPITSFP